VLKEEITDPDNLDIRTVLNGRIVQDANKSQMIFSVRKIVSNLSKSFTLLPGTVILTGTQDGICFTRKPPQFLKEGDVISIEIEKNRNFDQQSHA
jgi:2-keto-4-pentenoate hydratase/2-oxohepta-3-ene-1,7-dioic acid hydratase in catechol pathway